jgi:putative flippase GtrA
VTATNLSDRVPSPGPGGAGDARLPDREAHRTLWQKLTRCMGVSVVTTLISLATLGIATAVFGVAAWLANVLATALATGPSYHLNHRWTWGRRDASDPWRQLLPFWVLSFMGLALSTLAVSAGDAWAAGAHLAGPLHTATLLAAHLSGFGALWVVQFIVLDRVLFARTNVASPTLLVATADTAVDRAA